MTTFERTQFIRTRDLGHLHRLRTSAPARTGETIDISGNEAAIPGRLMGDGNLRRDPATRRWDGCIYRAKPARIRELPAGMEFGEGVRDRGGNRQGPEHAFRLRRAYVTGLLMRANLDSGAADLEGWIAVLNPVQRREWLRAIIDAEGHTRDGFT
ncbi:hypothetical protein [Nocardia niigatensis]